MGVRAARHATTAPFWDWTLETGKEQIAGFSAYGGRVSPRPARPFDSAQGSLTRRPSSIKDLVRLSKIDYLVDNVAGSMLSGLRHSVNDKARPRN